MRVAKGVIEHDFAQRWHSTVHNIREGADRMQAAADAIPPEPLTGAAGTVQVLVTRYTEALFDHAVALNCLRSLLVENSGE